MTTSDVDARPIPSDGRPPDVARTSRDSRTQTKRETQLPTTARDRTTERGEAKAAATTTHARVSQIDPWDALTRVVSLLRPDWQPERIRGALLDDRRPPRDVAKAAIAAALDPDVRHPGAIAHRSTGSTTPTPPRFRSEDDLCPDHLDAAATCKGCAADRKSRREETPA